MAVVHKLETLVHDSFDLCSKIDTDSGRQQAITTQAKHPVKARVFSQIWIQ